jgi:translation initiation factor 2 subunit 1
VQLKAEDASTEAIPIRVQLIAPPLYVMLTNTLDKVGGIEAMKAAIEAAKAEVERRGGTLVVKKVPTVTSNRDDTELQRMLEDLEAANAEISGDEESFDEASESEEEGEGSEEESAAGAGKK